MEYLYNIDSRVKRDSKGNIIYKKIKPFLSEFRVPEIQHVYIILKKVGKYENGSNRKSLYPTLFYHPFKYNFYYESIKECNSETEFKIYRDLIGVKNIEKIGDYEIV